MAGGEDESESVGVRLVLFGPVPSDVPRSEVQMLNEDHHIYRIRIARAAQIPEYVAGGRSLLGLYCLV